MDFYRKFFNLTFPSSINDKPIILSSLTKTKGPLIDLGCGPGRVLRIALENDREAIGVEIDPEMIKLANTYCKDINYSKLKFINDNFVDMPFKDFAGVITCWSNTFSMIRTSDERKKVIHQASKKLEKRGHLLIWIASDIDYTSTRPTQEKELPDGRLKWWSKVADDHKNMTRTFTHIYQFNNKEEVSTIETSIIPHNEILESIKDTSLKVVNFFGDFDCSSYTQHSPFQIFVLVNK